MIGSPAVIEKLRAFEREVQDAVNAAVKRVTAKYGLDGQVLVLGAESPESEAGQAAIATLQTIRSLIN